MAHEWHDWSSIEMAKPDSLSVTDRVYVRFRDGNESKIRIVGGLRWEAKDLPDDIVAWKFSHNETGLP